MTNGVVHYIYELHITHGVVYCIYEASLTSWYKTDNNDTLHDTCASLMTQCITHTNHQWRSVLHVTKNVAQVSVSSHVTCHQIMSHIIESCPTECLRSFVARILLRAPCIQSQDHCSFSRALQKRALYSLKKALHFGIFFQKSPIFCHTRAVYSISRLISGVAQMNASCHMNGPCHTKKYVMSPK